VSLCGTQSITDFTHTRPLQFKVVAEELDSLNSRHSSSQQQLQELQEMLQQAGKHRADIKKDIAVVHGRTAALQVKQSSSLYKGGDRATGWSRLHDLTCCYWAVLFTGHEGICNTAGCCICGLWYFSTALWYFSTGCGSLFVDLCPLTPITHHNPQWHLAVQLAIVTIDQRQLAQSSLHLFQSSLEDTTDQIAKVEQRLSASEASSLKSLKKVQQGVDALDGMLRTLQASTGKVTCLSVLD
jgi:hypothetical protein